MFKNSRLTSYRGCGNSHRNTQGKADALLPLALWSEASQAPLSSQGLRRGDTQATEPVRQMPIMDVLGIMRTLTYMRLPYPHNSMRWVLA